MPAPGHRKNNLRKRGIVEAGKHAVLASDECLVA